MAGGFLSEYVDLADQFQAGREMLARNQEIAMRKKQFEDQQKREALNLAQQQYALRGQLLSGVENQDQYAQVMPEIQRLGLPTGDIPEAPRSEAWKTFARPVEQRSKLPQWAQDQFKSSQATTPEWMPKSWLPGAKVDVPGYEAPLNEMPTGLMQNEANLSGLRKAAERGLTLSEQQRASGQDVRANLEAMRQDMEMRRIQAYMQDIAARAPREERKLSLAEEEAQRKAQMANAELGLKREGLQIEREKIAGADKPLAESQSNAALFGRRLEQGIADLDRVYTTFDPTSVKAAFELSNAKAGGARNAVSSPEAQEAAQAEKNIVTAILRKESGAAISPTEFATAEKQYFPRYGDAPGVVRQKRRNLEQALAGLRTAAGRGWDKTPLVGGQGAQVTEAAFKAAWSAAKPGEKVLAPDGKFYVKKGGK